VDPAEIVGQIGSADGELEPVDRTQPRANIEGPPTGGPQTTGIEPPPSRRFLTNISFTSYRRRALPVARATSYDVRMERSLAAMLPLLLTACTGQFTAPEPPEDEAPESGLPSTSVESLGLDCATDGEGRLTWVHEHVFLGQGEGIEGVRPRCQAAEHAVAGAAGSTLRVSLDDWSGSSLARLEIRDLLGEVVASLDDAYGSSSLAFELDRSGEYLVRLTPTDAQAGGQPYGLSLACVDGCDLEYTRHPIVLMHGMGGTDSYLDLLDYFSGVEELLEDAGYLVFAPAVDSFAPIDHRAGQWAGHLDGLMAEGQARRFNVIAHSQGGLDTRYLLHQPGWADRIVSLTTVSTPHRGTPTADLVTGALDISPLEGVVLDEIADALADWLGIGAEETTEAFADLTTERMAEFNEDYPDHPGVAYFSWAGHSCGILEPACIAEQNGEIILVALGPTYTLMWALGLANDGQVPVDSAIWADFLGELPADHANEVGHFIPLLNPPFDALAFYRDEARRLADLGL
jgi:triacylglycerol lipase